MSAANSDLFHDWPLPEEGAITTQLRTTLRLDQCKLRPFDYQVIGINRALMQPAFGLWDSMGLGKTLQIIVAAQLLFQRGLIDRVIVVAPATIRSVWFDEELGELQKHLFIPSLVSEFHAKIRQWRYAPGPDNSRLRWVITNYDFIRAPGRVEHLLKYCTSKTFLVLDEPAIKNRTTIQTKACFRLRAKCGRVVLADGTPISHSPLDLFTQGNFLDARILQCKSFYEFRSRYAIMRPNSSFPQIVGWQNLEDLQRRFKPFVLRRLKSEQNLPPKLPSVPHEVRLKDKTWTRYKEMRDDMVTWLDQQHVVVAAQVVVKVMRLLQLTSGFLGGVEVEEAVELAEEQELADWMESTDAPVFVAPSAVEYHTTVAEISREKLDYLLVLLKQLFDADPTLKVIVWSRFKPEYRRTVAALREKFPDVTISGITGGQKKAEREEAKRLLDPRTAPEGQAVVVMTAGHKGLNLTAASVNIYLSHDPSPDKRLQSEDRSHRHGQTRAVSYFDIVAYGPDGQKTWDHTTLKNRANRIDTAAWTAEAWRTSLTAE